MQRGADFDRSVLSWRFLFDLSSFDWDVLTDAEKAGGVRRQCHGLLEKLLRPLADQRNRLEFDCQSACARRRKGLPNFAIGAARGGIFRKIRWVANRLNGHRLVADVADRNRLWTTGVDLALRGGSKSKCRRFAAHELKDSL